MSDKAWRLILRLAIAGGFVALVYYFSWWPLYARPGDIRFGLWFVAALSYVGVMMVANWLLYWVARKPLSRPAADPQLSIDVFVTAYREPVELVRLSLQAACAMRVEHRTWLLDDGADPALASLATSLGAGYLTRNKLIDAKAGNLNAALARTDGQIVAIFDVDHVPAVNFLEHTVGFFADPRMGFVQVMLTFSNIADTWVAKASAETSLDFYNPTSLGAYEVGGATLMGSNALIRRQALESIGGYQPGLAEDLATSLKLHAAGWRSAYVAEPLAPGLAPPNLGAWFIQQLKWARGVFELLLMSFPRLFSKLTWGQRLSYTVRMTKYWIGPAVFFHLLATIGILIFANFETRAIFHEYLHRITPLIFFDILIRHLALRLFRHGKIPNTSLIRATTLVYATWPVYLYAWLLAVLRLPLKFRSTPKDTSTGLNPLWLLPQTTALIFLIGGILYTVIVVGHPVSILLLFAVLQATLELLLLVRWLHLEINLRRQEAQLLIEGHKSLR